MGKKDRQVVDKRLQEIAVDMLDMIASGEDEISVCTKFSIRRGTFITWMIRFPQFEKAVNEAKKQRADSFRSIIQNRLYDEEGKFRTLYKDEVPGEKLIFDKLKWLAEVDNPEKYGTKVKHEGNVSMPMQIVVDTGINNKKESIETTAEEVIENTTNPVDLL